MPKKKEKENLIVLDEFPSKWDLFLLLFKIFAPVVLIAYVVTAKVI